MAGRALFVPFGVFLLLACGGDDGPPSYSVETEREAIARITGTWKSDDGAIETTICEDMTTKLESTCEFAYQLRSTGGMRLAEKSEHGCGGGCVFGLGAAVRVEIAKKDGETTRFNAPAAYGADDGEPDATPGIYWPGPSMSGGVSISLGEDGVMKLRMFSAKTWDTLTRTGPATTCN